jgi:hypothetical protein
MGDCRRIATIRPRCLMLSFATKTQRGLLTNNYYTSKLLTSQQLSGVGDRNRTCFHGFAIQCLSNWLHLHNSGTACRNRTHIRRVEAYCIIHYTNAVLVRVEGLEPSIHYWRLILSQLRIPFRHTRINSIIHQTILQVNWYLE